MYTRRVVAMLALGAISCSDAAAPPLSSTDIVRDEVAASSPIRAERGVVRLEAYIDGRSSLQLGTPTLNTIRWFHHEYAAPGRLLGARLPTRFDDKDWYPNWPDLPDSENRDCQCSSYLEQHQLPLWPARYAVNVEVVRSRGTTTVLQQPATSGAFEIEFNDNPTDGADWYITRLDMRLPIELRSWPLQTPYVVSLTGDRYVTLVLLGDGGRNLFFADQANALSLGDDQRFDTPVAMGSQGRPLMELMDVNQDGASDLVARFAVAELLGNGDIALGARSMHLTAAANFGFFVKGDLRVTFVQ